MQISQNLKIKAKSIFSDDSSIATSNKITSIK